MTRQPDLDEIANAAATALAHASQRLEVRGDPLTITVGGIGYLIKLITGENSSATPTIMAVRETQPLITPRVKQRYGLSDRQAEIALLLAERLSNKEMSQRLNISVHTVGTHVRVTMLKLGVSRRSDVRKTLEESSRNGDFAASSSPHYRRAGTWPIR